MISFQKPIIGLSPMDGITDEPFRLLQSRIAKPDLMFTEFVSAEGLSRGGVKLYDVLLYSKEERPIVGQLFGKDPESFYKSAIILAHLGFDGVDINMGCPAKTVIQHGSGGALIENPTLASEIIKSTQKGITDWYQGRISIDNLDLNQKTHQVIKRNLKYSIIKSLPFLKGRCPEGTGRFVPSVSVKTRLGINDKVYKTWIPFLLQHRLDFITIHGRTLKQGYSGSTDWPAIQECAQIAKSSNTPIFGNGDIQSRQQGMDYCKKYGVSGVLIGRASTGNPWVFKDREASLKEKYSTMLLHTQLFQSIFPSRRLDSMRKHFLLYSTGHLHAKKLRAHLVRVNSLNDLLSLEDEFLNC
ncbi:MAG: tRNA-dihydrouridine synthase [Candidatus Shapirobacteria bacterium]|jgi:tRNA-dihydrouridine synthase